MFVIGIDNHEGECKILLSCFLKQKKANNELVRF